MTAFVEWRGTAVGINRRIARGRGGGAPRVSDEYKAFVEDLWAAIRQQVPAGTRYDGPVTVLLEQRSHHDVDALAKPVLDALETAGVIANDRQVQSLRILRGVKVRTEPDEIDIWVMEAG